MAAEHGLKAAAKSLVPRGLIYATYEQRLLRNLDRARLPEHVAVLADGNRRWARANAPGQELVVGYRAGAAKLTQFIGWCEEVGVPIVTLWVLSTENLERSGQDEVGPLLEVIRDLVVDLASEGTRRVQVVGDLNLLPADMAADLRAAEAASADAPGLHVNVAVSYGGRHELRDAVRSLLRFTDVFVMAMFLTFLLPICALAYATSSLGGEREERTLVFLLTRPVPRWL